VQRRVQQAAGLRTAVKRWCWILRRRLGGQAVRALSLALEEAMTAKHCGYSTYNSKQRMLFTKSLFSNKRGVLVKS
jgi:hypothetical protein